MHQNGSCISSLVVVFAYVLGAPVLLGVLSSCWIQSRTTGFYYTGTRPGKTPGRVYWGGDIRKKLCTQYVWANMNRFQASYMRLCQKLCRLVWYVYHEQTSAMAMLASTPENKLQARVDIIWCKLDSSTNCRQFASFRLHQCGRTIIIR